jgi:Flp pilus assembly protein TadG
VTARSILARLSAANDGGSAVEFAIVGPLLISLLIGMAEFARIATTQVLLEGAARDASRYGVTGSVTPGQPPTSQADREAQIKNIVARETVGLVDMSKIVISMKAYSDFSDVGTAPGQTGAGGADQVVVYTLTYDQPLITNLFAGMVKKSAIRHDARVVVRNEPFDASN